MKYTGKDQNMRIENEMLKRLDKTQSIEVGGETNLSAELDFFFDNVMDTVVEFFTERKELRVQKKTQKYQIP